MPSPSQQFDTPIPKWHAEDVSRLPGDTEFDRIFPEPIREVSEYHWSSVEVCRHAAKWLVTGSETRVLDVGSGPGKFCAIGAVSTRGHFTGVEQRLHLCRIAWGMLDHYKIPRVKILHANVTEVEFNCFDAFYLFNPFQENLEPALKIDNLVPVRLELYDRYINYVRRELTNVRLGTRVVTFWGDCDEIPPSYECVETAFGGELRLWIKRRVGACVRTAREKFSLPSATKFTIV